MCCYCWRCSLFSAEKNHGNGFLATLGWVWTIWFSCEFKPNSFTSSASVAPLKSPLMCRQRWESITTHHSSFYSVTLHLCWRCFVSLKSTPGHEMLLGHNPEMKPKLKTLMRHYIVFWKYSHWQIQLIISAKPPIFLCNNLLMDSATSFPSFHLMTAAQLCDLCVSDSWCGKTPNRKLLKSSLNSVPNT